MTIWPSERIQRLLDIDLPIIQAPMAGVDSPQMAAGVSEAGGLGSLACALLSPDQIRDAWTIMRAKAQKPVNLNFFCHEQKTEVPAQQEKWKKRLAGYYKEFGLDTEAVQSSATRAPFDENFCETVEELKPEAVSFHFGLPAVDLLKRVKETGATIFSSATTLEEALWLEKNGCDAIIAQGLEAGGHRGMFLTSDLETQVSTEDLLNQIVGKVSVPIIAAGGIKDAQDIKAMLNLGADAVQMGTAYLFCPEAKISPLYRAALKNMKDEDTVVTNIFSGRPARGITNRFIREVGPISADAPDFPYASRLLASLRKKSEEAGSVDFMQLWAGRGARNPREIPAGELTKKLAEETLALF